MKKSLYVNGAWSAVSGPAFISRDPATGEALWEGGAAGEGDVDAACRAAAAAFPAWARLSFAERLAHAEKFRAVAERRREEIIATICRETGKMLWDVAAEAASVVGKVALAAQAYYERTGEKSEDKGGYRQELRHRPHGVLAVFGPYNFPMHLANGHIVPALLAGNTVVFKPSEETPLSGELMVKLWEEAGLPPGVVNLVQGGRETGVALAKHPDLAGILFTGSYATGKKLHEQLAGRPDIILALEMGGNNPLVVWDAADKDAAARIVVQSAYMTSGQRCTCARRLMIAEGREGDALLEALTRLIARIRVGAWNEEPEPFMGPLINATQAQGILQAQEKLEKAGGKILARCRRMEEKGEIFLSPGLIDVTVLKDRPDVEHFGPLLQVIRVPDFAAAVREANNTAYGLSSGLVSDNAALWEEFRRDIRAGLANWNRPTTGASSGLPFGGMGHSGNHRPAAWYAADYCAYPVSTLAADAVAAEEIRGLRALAR